MEEETNFCPSCGTQVSGIHDLESKNPPTATEHARVLPADKGGSIGTYPLAGFWIRLGAFWMDGLIILLLAMFFGSLVYSTAPGRELFINMEKINLFLVLLFIFYHSLFLGRFRTTPGKKLFGLAVIPLKPSARFGYSEAFLRTLAYFISEVFLGVGFLWIAFNKNKQGWHDKIARTSVIKKAEVSLIHRLATLILVTFLVIVMIALQFNLTFVYQSMFSHGNRPWRNRGKEIVSVLVTQREIKNGIFKEIATRAGPYAIKLPTSAHDGEIFKVNRTEEEGGIFYIRIVIVERV